MAGGFDSTAFNVGILQGANNNIAKQQKDVEEGEKAQYQAFQKASEEYQTTKNKTAEKLNKIDALAPMLRGEDSSDAAKLASLAVARNGVELGYTEQTHLPYLQEAYKRTIQDVNQNPDKWKVAPASSSDTPGWGSMDDKNPTNTAAIKKFAPGTSDMEIQAIKSGKVEQPYSNVPNNAIFGDPNDVANKQAYDKATIEGQAKQDIKNRAEKKVEHEYGMDMPDEAFKAAPTSSSNASSTGNQFALNASDLAPNATDGGIHLSGPGQVQDTSGTAQTKPVDPNAPNEAYLDYVRKQSPTAAANVKLMAQGKLPLTGYMFGRPDPETGGFSKWDQVAIAAHRYDPSFDPTKYASRQALRTEYEKGQTSTAIAAANTAFGHAAMLQQAGEALDSGNVKVLNKIANAYGIQTGAAPQAVYSAIAHRLSDEVVRFYRNTGGSDDDIKRANADFSLDASSMQKSGVIGATVNLMKTRLDYFKDKWEHDMGPSNKDDIQFYTPKTMEALKTLEKSTNVTDQILTPSKDNDQSVPTVNTPEEALKLPPGSQFKTPDGRLKTVPTPSGPNGA